MWGRRNWPFPDRKIFEKFTEKISKKIQANDAVASLRRLLLPPMKRKAG